MSEIAQQHRDHMRAASNDRRTREYRQEQVKETTTIGAPLPKAAVDITSFLPPMPAHGYTVAYIPDTQCAHGTPVEHLRAAGRYIAAHRPDIVVCAGDFADMHSLNRHNEDSSLKKEGARYIRDIDAAKRGMDALVDPIAAEPGYDPAMILTLGNHEDLISRYIEKFKVLQGFISVDDLQYESYGWKVVPFLQPVAIGGVAFSHYFPHGKMGMPVGSAMQLLTTQHMSCVAGHQQGRQVAYARRGDGQQMTGIIAGSFYQHDMDYLDPLSNKHWRGMLIMHEVRDGAFDEMWLSINYLLRKWQ